MFAEGGPSACESKTEATVLALAPQPRTRPPRGRLGPATAGSQPLQEVPWRLLRAPSDSETQGHVGSGK